MIPERNTLAYRMFLKRVKYYIYNMEELELTVKVVKTAYRQAIEFQGDLDRFENEGGPCE